MLEAGNTDEALLIINAWTTTPDIVLADAQAQGRLDGFGLAKWIRENRRSIKVILSGTVRIRRKKRGSFASKVLACRSPMTPEQLIDRIKRALAVRDRPKQA